MSTPKKYVLLLSKHFPKTHPKAGQETGFWLKVCFGRKMHTIRGNYALWEKRIKEVNEGNAIISLREWVGDPYKSKQRELKQFHGSDVGIQKLDWTLFGWFINDMESNVWTIDLARNDGLSLEDFSFWFKARINCNPVDLEPMAIIHFTDFRY